jgi:flagellar capping protein FliD
MKREVLIQGETTEYRVLYTNRALLNVETWTGKSIIQIVRGFLDGKSGVNEIARLLQAGMDAARKDAGTGNKQVTLEDALDALDDIGTINALNQLQDAVGGVLNKVEGDQEPDPNA